MKSKANKMVGKRKIRMTRLIEKMMEQIFILSIKINKFKSEIIILN
jgi:hypothetical protein